MNFGYGSRFENWQPPLFQLGKLRVTVTVLVLMLQVLGMLVGSFLPKLFPILGLFIPMEFRGGALWQVMSYAFFQPPSFNFVLGSFFFYLLGSRLENSLSRGSYVRFLLALLLVAPVVVLIADFLTVRGMLIGSDIAHFGVFVAAVSMFPNVPSFILGIRIKWFAVVFGVIHLLQLIMGSNWGGCLALGISVWLAVWWMRKAGFVEKWGVVEDSIGSRLERQARLSSVRKSKGVLGKSESAKARKKKRVYEKKIKPRTTVPLKRTLEVDLILDKISAEGMHSLTDEEREILQKASKR